MPSRTVRTIGCMIFLSGLLFFEGTTSHPYAALSVLSLVTILSGCEINNFAGQSAKSVCYNLVAMFDLFRLWLGAVLSGFRTRRSLLLENLALRQQLAVFKRQQPRPRLGAMER